MQVCYYYTDYFLTAEAIFQVFFEELHRTQPDTLQQHCHQVPHNSAEDTLVYIQASKSQRPNEANIISAANLKPNLLFLT
jgi:hypothetical protein